MKILITGICGFLGSSIALRIKEALAGTEIIGIDNLSRKGSAFNKTKLKKIGVKLLVGDYSDRKKMMSMQKADWVIDCAANPSVLAGIGKEKNSGSIKLLDDNLIGTLNVLEYCKANGTGLILISTSRVYSIEHLLKIKLNETSTRFEPSDNQGIKGFSKAGISEEFPVENPVSLYGATKVCSEVMALEYGDAFSFPVWINRSGVIAGPGQFGRIDQGIFSYWAYSALFDKPLKFIGYNGSGKQARDCVCPEDVADLVIKQIRGSSTVKEKIINIGGGSRNSMSLLELNAACERLYGKKIPVGKIPENRPYDIPYVAMDYSKAEKLWNWKPTKTADQIVEEICKWSLDNKDFIRSLW